MISIDEAKKNDKNYIKYKLKNATVWTGEHGYTFSLFMDKESNNSNHEIDKNQYERIKRYVKTQLQSNKQRYTKHVNTTLKYITSDEKILDIGCGGGLFLSELKKCGYEGEGIELDPLRLKICNEQGLIVYGEDVTENSFIANNAGKYSAISYWDVIEHVNYPSKHIKSAAQLLNENGYIFLDTPAKDSFYHRVGNFLYWITRGKVNIFLDIMYSEHPFGHKQIFSSSELSRELEAAGFKVTHIEFFHELSFPYEYYLSKIFKYVTVVKIFVTLVKLLFKIFPIKNKMLIVGRKL